MQMRRNAVYTLFFLCDFDRRGYLMVLRFTLFRFRAHYCPTTKWMNVISCDFAGCGFSVAYLSIDDEPSDQDSAVNRLRNWKGRRHRHRCMHVAKKQCQRWEWRRWVRYMIASHFNLFLWSFRDRTNCKQSNCIGTAHGTHSHTRTPATVTFLVIACDWMGEKNMWKQ